MPGLNNRDKPKSSQCPCINEIMQEPKARHLPCSVPPVQQLKIFPKQMNEVRDEATLQPATQTPHQPKARAEPGKKLNLCSVLEH